jgi:hypothetical protein
MDGFGNMVEFYNGVGLYINKSEVKSFPLKISSVSVEGKFHYFDFPEKLSYSQNSFIFNYAALDYKDPDQTTYEHFLEGYDKDWSRPGNLAFAEYQNLPSGDYTFRVRGTTSNGIKTNEAAYSFIVSPPYWRTWWAYVLYGLIFIGGWKNHGNLPVKKNSPRQKKSKKLTSNSNPPNRNSSSPKKWLHLVNSRPV